MYENIQLNKEDLLSKKASIVCVFVFGRMKIVEILWHV